MEKKIEDYPYNLLISARGRMMLNLPTSLTRDIQAGIIYALFTLEEAERVVLDEKYRLGMPLNDTQQEIEKRALKKLCRPCRWDYICYGVVGCMKKKVEEARRKGFEQGYYEGYTFGTNRHGTIQEEQRNVCLMDLPIEVMPLSQRVRNALRRSGCRVVRDVAMQNIAAIQCMRNIGEKGVREVLAVLRSYGITHSEWEQF